MYEIFMDDETDSHLLATHATIPEAVTDVERLEAVTRAQLDANGEGHSDFWLRLVVRDVDGTVVAFSCTGIGSEAGGD